MRGVANPGLRAHNRRMTQSSSTPNSDDSPRPASGYEGDISPLLAWQWVQAGQAVLVDVRSDAERAWVGSCLLYTSPSPRD